MDYKNWHNQAKFQIINLKARDETAKCALNFEEKIHL